jgi:hypothetical protein
MAENPHFPTALVNTCHEEFQQNKQIQLGDTWKSPFMYGFT